MKIDIMMNSSEKSSGGRGSTRIVGNLGIEELIELHFVPDTVLRNNQLFYDSSFASKVEDRNGIRDRNTSKVCTPKMFLNIADRMTGLQKNCEVLANE